MAIPLIIFTRENEHCNNSMSLTLTEMLLMKKQEAAYLILFSSSISNKQSNIKKDNEICQ